MPSVTSTPGDRLRCAWEVTAGLIPGQPMQEYSRSWLLTSEAYYSPEGPEHFKRLQQAASDYALSLQEPRMLNWVRLDWIYL